MYVIYLFISLYYIILTIINNYLKNINSNINNSNNNKDKDKILIIDNVKWSYCKKCSKAKPPRCHHCSVCDKCVLKMDHHCPWIGGCVGFYNYRYFFLFLSYLWVSVCYVLAHSLPLLFGGYLVSNSCSSSSSSSISSSSIIYYYYKLTHILNFNSIVKNIQKLIDY